MAASDIGVGAAIALDGPDTVETMLAHYGSAFAATDPVPADAIGPIGLRIPVPAELEAEIIAAMAIAPVLFRIELPVGLCVPARLVGLLNLALVFFIHSDAALFGITLVFLVRLIIRPLHFLRAASVRMLRAIVALFAVTILCACCAGRGSGHQCKERNYRGLFHQIHRLFLSFLCAATSPARHG